MYHCAVVRAVLWLQQFLPPVGSTAVLRSTVQSLEQLHTSTLLSTQVFIKTLTG